MLKRQIFALKNLMTDVAPHKKLNSCQMLTLQSIYSNAEDKTVGISIIFYFVSNLFMITLHKMCSKIINRLFPKSILDLKIF